MPWLLPLNFTYLRCGSLFTFQHLRGFTKLPKSLHGCYNQPRSEYSRVLSSYFDSFWTTKRAASGRAEHDCVYGCDHEHHSSGCIELHRRLHQQRRLLCWADILGLHLCSSRPRLNRLRWSHCCAKEFHHSWCRRGILARLVQYWPKSLPQKTFTLTFFLPAPTGVALIVAVVFRQRLEISIHFCWFLLLDATLNRLLMFTVSGIRR